MNAGSTSRIPIMIACSAWNTSPEPRNDQPGRMPGVHRLPTFAPVIFSLFRESALSIISCERLTKPAMVIILEIINRLVRVIACQLLARQKRHRKKIIEVSQTLFSNKGFDATRVDDIAKAAGVNKALIYYYFKSKDDILTHLIQMLLDDVSVIVLEFVKTTIVSMYEKGRLDIQRNCWSFVSETDAQNFHQELMNYYEKLSTMHCHIGVWCVFLSWNR